MQLRNGDDVPNGKGGFCSSEGGQAVVDRILFQLTARRGAFPLLPELGSRIYTLAQEKASRRGDLAKQYVEEALAGEKDLAVEQVYWDEGQKGLRVLLRWQGKSLPIFLETERRGEE